MKAYMFKDADGKATFQVGYLGRLKKGTPFFHANKTEDGHNWVRIGRVIITDCNCLDLKDGSPL